MTSSYRTAYARGIFFALIFMQKSMRVSRNRVPVCFKSIFDLVYPISRIKELIHRHILAIVCNEKSRRLTGGIAAFMLI